MYPKFRTVPLGQLFNRSQFDSTPWEDISAESVAGLPTGRQTFWGIPFEFGSSDDLEVSNLLVIGADGSTDNVTVEIGSECGFIVLAHVCDSRSMSSVAGQTSDYVHGFTVTSPGEHLADYVLLHESGHVEEIAIRRRFEVNQVHGAGFGRAAFMARQHFTPEPFDMFGPIAARMWGWYQTGVSLGPPFDELRGVGGAPRPTWSLFALPVIRRDDPVVSLELRPTGAATLGVGAVTAFAGAQNPLRWDRLRTVVVDGSDEVDIEVDLGVVARERSILNFDPSTWLGEDLAGRGERPDIEIDGSAFEIAAAEDAEVKLNGHGIALASLTEERTTVGDTGLSIRVVGGDRSWVHVSITDAASGAEVAARIHFRSSDGIYIAPHGHRTVVNDNWFEDYGADLRLGATNYAYVDGRCQVELPIGEVFVEVAKGFEYEPVRQAVRIEPGQRTLRLAIDRSVDWQREGWVTADTHVHFLSPETARLEGEAEGVNVINVLAAQWGDLFTNVGDITGELSGSSTSETLIWVGTENRNHFLGHISLLGTNGDPVFPLSSSGLQESYFGDPTWRAMSEWADENRDKGGLVVVPHFPWPLSEVFAEIVLGKVDGLEVWDFWTPTMNTFSFGEYYRLLNCGYRVPLVGGTDKMSAGMPVGNVRTYAKVDDGPLSFDQWARAVKSGRTFTTSGPLVSLDVEGHAVGDVISLARGGGTLHVSASAVLVSGKLNRLQLIQDGRVVAETTSKGGEKRLELDMSLDVSSSGWLAVRCSGNDLAWSVWPQYLVAHSSPIYVDVDGVRPWDDGVANYLVTTLEGGMAWLDTLATHDSQARHEEIRQVFASAIREIRHPEAPDGRA